MPGIVICGHGDEGVGDFGFAEEFGFGHGGHVDDGDGGVGGEGAVEEGFGAGGELGAFCLDTHIYISQRGGCFFCGCCRLENCNWKEGGETVPITMTVQSL